MAWLLDGSVPTLDTATGWTLDGLSLEPSLVIEAQLAIATWVEKPVVVNTQIEKQVTVHTQVQKTAILMGVQSVI